MKNGSIFCSCKEDELLKGLDYFKTIRPDFLIVESSGLSDPSGFTKILSLQKYSSDYLLYNSICLIDLSNILKLINITPVIRKQIRSSNLLVLNKADLAKDYEMEIIHEILEQNNTKAEIIETKFGDIEQTKVFSYGLNNTQIKPFLEHLPNHNSVRITYEKEFHSLDKVRQLYFSIKEYIQRLKGIIKIASTQYIINSNGEQLDIEEINLTDISDNISIILPRKNEDIVSRILKD